MGAGLLITHLAALLPLPFAALPPPAIAALAAALAASLAWYWPRHASRVAPGCVRTLTWAADGACRLQRRDGRELQATLVPRAFVQPWLVILRLREPGHRRRYLVILPDMLDGASFRRLRVRLRLELDQPAPGPAAAGHQP
jgi:hypothetical protein